MIINKLLPSKAFSRIGLFTLLFALLVIILTKISFQIPYLNYLNTNQQEVKVRIKKIEENKYLEIVFPESINEGKIEKYFVKIESGKWTECRFKDRLCTFDKIASISFVLPKNVPLVLVGGPNSSKIEISINGKNNTVDLQRQQDEFVSIKLTDSNN